MVNDTYKYGVSFDCIIDPMNQYIRIGYEFDLSVSLYDYISNNLAALINHTITKIKEVSHYDRGFCYTSDHTYVGLSVQGGGTVIGVFHYEDEDDTLLCVLVEDPNYLPKIIE